MAFTTTDLLSSVYRRAFVPTGQTTFTAAEILAMAGEVLRTDLVPDLVRSREDFHVVSDDQTIVEGTAEYLIPARATGQLLRDVWIIATDGTTITRYPRSRLEQVTTQARGAAQTLYLQGGAIVFDQPPSAPMAGKTLRQFIYLAPSDMIDPADAGVVSAINTVTGVVTVTTIPSTWATGNTFDFIRSDGGQEPWAIDQDSTLVSGNTITFASLPSRLRIGDYVALAGQTPLVALPDNYRPVLAQGTAAFLLAATNQPGADAARKAYAEMRKNVYELVKPRVQGTDEVVTPTNWF